MQNKMLISLHFLSVERLLTELYIVILSDNLDASQSEEARSGGKNLIFHCLHIFFTEVCFTVINFRRSAFSGSQLFCVRNATCGRAQLVVM